MGGDWGEAAERGAEVERAGQTAAGDVSDCDMPHKGCVH